jgi:CO/xanthine dehydrogenase FAD-binding subunit
MEAFKFTRAASVADAMTAFGKADEARYLAGGSLPASRVAKI